MASPKQMREKVIIEKANSQCAISKKKLHPLEPWGFVSAAAEDLHPLVRGGFSQ